MSTGAYFILLLAFLGTSFAQERSRTHRRMQTLIFPTVSSDTSPDDWEEWSQWTACSRTCGGGVKEQRRNCRMRNVHSESSAWQCNGSNKKHQSCNLIPCPDGSINTRRAKCSDYNRRLFAGNTYVWEPMNRGGPCQLSCKARGHRLFVRHATQVTDGTDCSYSMPRRGRRTKIKNTGASKHICIEGRCMETGCDGVVGSRLVVDKCGVCGGNGETCQSQQGVFRLQNLENDFHVVVTIPAGAIRINVTEQFNTRSFLALRVANPNGPFYINGELKLGHPDPSNSYQVAGTTFEYQRPYRSTKGETITAEGPTNEDLNILLYFQGMNPGILYDYIIPRPTPTPGLPSNPTVESNRHGLLDNSGDVGGRFNPSRPASNPSHRRYYHGRNGFNGINNPYRVPRPGFTPRHPVAFNGGDLPVGTVNGRYPYWGRGNQQPESGHDNEEDSNNAQRFQRWSAEVNRQENIGEAAWEMQGFSLCSKSCAEGVRTSVIKCLNVETNEPVDDSYCTGQRPPVTTRKCNRQSCPPYYDVGKWSHCSRTCGNGRRTRRVVCRQHFAGNFTTAVSHKKCRGLPKPMTHEKCKTRACAHWEMSRQWSKCSVRCGSGTQIRRSTCKGGNGETLPDGMCAAGRRPSNIRSCDAGPCVTKWYVTDWEECSADCDRGLQRRNVFCLNTAGSVAGCASRFEPNATRTCARSSCGVKYEWFSGRWDTCSSKCGNGVQERQVTCLSVQPDGTMAVALQEDGRPPCDASEKPAIQQPCNTQSCGSRWHYTPWSECSVSCGGGSRTRDVQCLDESGYYSSLCDNDERPKEAERCNTVSCLSLIDPNCEDRLKKCQLVLQARLCAYTYYRTMCCVTCSLPRASVRPERLP